METSPELAIRRYALPFRSPLRTARGAWTVREGILIRVTGADGRLGYGEIAPIQGFGGRPLDDCAAELERLGRFPAREALVTQAKVLPGLRVAPTPGHTWGHQSVRWRDSLGTVCFPGDLIPTVHHLHPSASLGYDMLPYETMLTKRALLEQASREGWRLVLDHEPGECAVRPVGAA